jgi:cytoskeleton protein RodZ
VGKFGDKLRREREMRGVTLDEIAEATKIGTRSLRALEEERFDQLPGGIFNKGFVRSYARFLGLDEEQAVADYVAAQSDQPSKADVLEKMAAQAEAARRNEAASVGDKGRFTGIWIATAVLILIVIGAGGGWKYYQQKQAEQQKADIPPRIQTAPPAPASLTPADSSAQIENGGAARAPGETVPSATSVPVTSAAMAVQPAAVPPRTTASTAALGSKQPLELQIHVVRATWLSVQADGKEPTTETLRDSATKTVTAQDRVVLTTGNSVEVTCNGISLGILGEDNKRSQVRISADCKVN